MKKLVLLALITPLFTGCMLGTNSDTYTPEYLSVPDFKKCLGEKSEGSMKSWCLPDEKPQGCSLESWQKLNQDESGSIPKCDLTA